MAKRQDCIDEILNAAGGRRSRAEAEAILEDINDTAEGYQRSGMNAREAYERARDEKIDGIRRESAIRRRAARLDAGKSRDAVRFAETVKNSGKFGDAWGKQSTEALLVGVNHRVFDKETRIGNQHSAAALGLGALNRFSTGIEHDLRALERGDRKMVGLYESFVTKEMQRDIFLEKWELDSGKYGQPGVTKNERALAIAKVLSKYDRARIDLLNGEGAWIEDRRAHTFRNTSDPDKMRKAGGVGWFQKGFTMQTRGVWVGDAMKHLDTEAMFPGWPKEDVEKLFSNLYGGMVTGDHLRYALIGGEDIAPNVAAKVSKHRAFIFKSAQDMLDYNAKYGRFDPTDTWVHDLRESSRQYGLMKIFGSKPKEGLQNLVAYIENQTMGTAARQDFDRWTANGLWNRFAYLSGEASMPVYGAWRSIANGLLSVGRLSKLGLTPFAMLQDNTTISRELSRQGAEFWERNGSMMSDYFKGADGSAKREVAELTYAGLMADLHASSSRLDIGDAVNGALAKAEQYFWKWTGIQAMTDNKRQNAIRMMARHWGLLRGKNFADLGENEARMLEAYGVGDSEWKLLNQVDWHDVDGATYLTPDIADRLSNAQIEDYLRGRGIRADRLSGEGPAELIRRTRQDLAVNLHSYLADRGNYAVLEVGDKERAMLYGGQDPSWRPGTPKGEAWRLLMQFKQFPVAMVTRGWLADIQGLSGMKRLTGIVELVVSSTLFGMAANFLNQAAKGQDPTSQWRNQPGAALLSGFLRGGSGSIYGDFLFGEFSRFGTSALDTLAGPTFGQFNNLAELWTDVTHPSKWKTGAIASAARFVRGNLPFMNMIWTKSLFDYLIWYRVMEYIQPGFNERMERNMKQRNGIEFLLRPTQVSR